MKKKKAHSELGKPYSLNKWLKKDEPRVQNKRKRKNNIGRYW